MAENALPDLKARLLLDDATASQVVQKLIDQLKAMGTEGETSGTRAASGVGKIGTSAEKSTALVDKLKAGLKQAADSTARITEIGVGSATGGVFGKMAEFGGAFNLPVVGALAGAAGLLGTLESLTEKTAAYSTEVLRNSDLLGLNTTLYQTLAQAGQVLGLDQQTMTVNLERFQRNIESGAPQLSQMGLSLKDLGITTTDTGTALQELSSWLENTSNAAERNAVAMSLLGRGATALNELLQKGPQFLQEYQTELEKYGLILTDTQLKTGALAQTTNNEFHLALQGIEMQVGTQLEGAFAGLWETLVQMAGGSQELFQKIGQGIATVVGWIASLIQGLFGVTVDMSTLSTTATDASAALNAMAASGQDASASTTDLAASGKAAKDAAEELRIATQQQTDAIDDQVKALQAQASQYQASVQDEITAIQQREQAVSDQMRDQQLLQQLQDATHQSYLSQLQDELNAVTSTQDDRRRNNESLVDYERRLEENSLRDKIKAEEDRRSAEKDTADINLQHLRELDQAQVDNLKAQEQRQKDETQAEVDQLNARKTALSRHLQAVQDAVTQSSIAQQGLAASTTAAMSGDYGALATNVGKDAGRIQGTMGGVFAGLEIHSSETAKKIGGDLRGLFSDPGGALGKLAGDLGSTLGMALAKGFASAVSDLVALTPLGLLEDNAAAGLARITGKTAGALKQFLAAINSASSIDEINQYGQQAAQANIFDDAEMQQIQAAANARARQVGGRPPGRASGGTLEAGRVYQVGEQGPEPVVFGQPGYVVSRTDAMAAVGQAAMRSRAGGGGGGGGGSAAVGSVELHSHFYGPVATPMVARRVADEQYREARRRGLLQRQGTVS